LEFDNTQHKTDLWPLLLQVQQELEAISLKSAKRRESMGAGVQGRPNQQQDQQCPAPSQQQQQQEQQQQPCSTGVP